MNDTTETYRRAAVAELNGQVESTNPDQERIRLQSIHGADNVWNTNEVGDKFEITGFMAPFCFATRIADGKKGILEFQHYPRFYFNFSAK